MPWPANGDGSRHLVRSRTHRRDRSRYRTGVSSRWGRARAAVTTSSSENGAGSPGQAPLLCRGARAPHRTSNTGPIHQAALHRRRAETLGAAQVAAAHHISERHLYNILGASGITLADWIRKQRLERCRNDIAAPAFHATPIASIARGWGFTDPSSFTRMFKSAYGMSPRAWRHQANARRSEPTGELINP